MWVFGYGSLMWDEWEVNHGCTRRALADLLGYERRFNKASVRNWGTKANACPTLNLVPSTPSSACRGIAFAFPSDRADQVRAYLEEREGKSFVLRTLPVRLDDGSRIEALVPLYEGKNIISNTDPTALARMVASAEGTDGSCVEYIRGVERKLAKEGIEDPVVAELAKLISGQ